jgi:hypothetical protein
MTLRPGTLVGLALVAVAAAGCVADPYSRDRYGRPHQPAPYDDRYDHAPPNRPHDRDDSKLPTMVCASKGGRPKRCQTDIEIKGAEIDKRYSGSPCELGRSWGWDRNEVWVDRGCRARFVLLPARRWR